MMQTESPPPPPPQQQQLSSPSFSSYSSETFAQIAARVIHELQNDLNFTLNDHTLFHPSPLNDDHDFEFASVSRQDANANSSSADEIFPLFGRQILNSTVVSAKSPDNGVQTETVARRLPLRALMFEERKTTWSCSSSGDGGNELEGVDAESYCAWTPRAHCKKSSSLGSSNSSSRRWRLRDLLLSRSHSEGKDPVLIANRNNKVAPKNSGGDGAAKDGDLVKRKLFLNPKLN